MAKTCLYLRLSDLVGWELHNSGTLSYIIFAGGVCWLSRLNKIATDPHLIWAQGINGRLSILIPNSDAFFLITWHLTSAKCTVPIF